jgi:hypothetical protein
MTIKFLGVRKRTDKKFLDLPALEIDVFIALVKGKSDFLLVHVPTGVIFFASPIVSNCLIYAFAIKESGLNLDFSDWETEESEKLGQFYNRFSE